MPLSTTDRVIRVFVSSTFRDMMQERDLLVKEVFPALRRLCARRFVTFTEVDLRWGITEEQAQEGQVLPLCLAEIERSRPYFIGLLGERYGWTSHETQPELIARQPWLREHLLDHTSVTELEILHGVLRDPSMDGHAYFYFRDPSYLTRLPPEVNPDDYQSENDEAKTKLAALKKRILTAQDNGTCICQVDYADPQTVAGWILDDFTALINRLYPEAEVLDPLAQERLGHDAHARNKLFACIDRPQHQEALRAFAERTDRQGKGLVVTGDSGCGKTVLFAAWAHDWAQNHPDDFLFQHYFGASPSSTSPDGFVSRLLGELKQRFDVPDEIPVGSDKLREALPHWLAKAIGKRRIVLVLDGLNQVQGTDVERRLNFLPSSFPPHVTVLASSLPGPALDALRERGWNEHHLLLADRSEIDAMVGEYFRIHSRHVDVEGRPLDTPLRWQLVAAPGCENPLFLRTLLEELRQFGSFEKLPARVAHYLEADTPQALFQRVLIRWQEDFDRQDQPREPGKPGLVRRALMHLWAARQGLSEGEWLDLLGTGYSPLPRAHWSPLFLALEPHLSQRSGLFAFGHDFLRQAVDTEFLSSQESRVAAHVAMAKYFEQHLHQQDMSQRKAAEWPYQRHAAATIRGIDGDSLWNRLEGCLTDVPLFLALYNAQSKWELTAYWQPLRRLNRDMAECYLKTADRHVTHYEQGPMTLEGDEYCAYFLGMVGRFLSDNGLFSAAQPLTERSLAAWEQIRGPEHHNTLAIRTTLAYLLERQGDYAGAERHFRRLMAIQESIAGSDRSALASAMNNLANFLTTTSQLDEAVTLARRALVIQEECFGPQSKEVLSPLNNLAHLLKVTNRLSEAEQLTRRALKTARNKLGQESDIYQCVLNNYSGILLTAGRYEEADVRYREALGLAERIYGVKHPRYSASVNNLACLMKSLGRFEEAESLLRKALKIDEECFGSEHPTVATRLSNLAGVLLATSRTSEAESLVRRALLIDERSRGPDHPTVAIRICNLAEILGSTQRIDEGEQMARRALETLEKGLGSEHPDVACCLDNLGALIQKTGRVDEAELVMRRAIDINERSFGMEHPNVAASLGNLATLLQENNRTVEAEPLIRRALRVLEKSVGPNHPDVARQLNNLAQLLISAERTEEAEPMMHRALKIAEGCHGPDHLNVVAYLNNMAGLMEKTCRPQEAERILRRALAIEEVAFGSDAPSLAPALNKLAMLLANQKQYKEAEVLMLRQAEILLRLTLSGKSHPGCTTALEKYGYLLTLRGYSKKDVLAKLGQLSEGVLSRYGIGEAPMSKKKSWWRFWK